MRTFLSDVETPDRKQLVGIWKLNHSAKVQDRISEPDDHSTASKMLIRFRANGRLSTTTAMGNIDSEKSGSWQFVEFDQETRMMTIKCTLGGQESEHQIEFLADDIIKLTPPNMAGLNSKLEFRRE